MRQVGEEGCGGNKFKGIEMMGVLVTGRGARERGGRRMMMMTFRRWLKFI